MVWVVNGSPGTQWRGVCFQSKETFLAFSSIRSGVPALREATQPAAY